MGLVQTKTGKLSPTVTVVDRLAHHGHILLFEGENYCMKHALMRQKDQIKLPMA
ncbi:hypothetical protein SPIROBIBN47_90046 [uncultured spirochete]|uniref:Uncharacterized protein n=1 Tax=uncultured spirochete TaxID=156406 RepID=A0A3P3XM25_9SPIR|nr:hypothetical protein SPIROBIBN47_90046 [uncultured spirochete]